jgi:hypothetical protein
VVGALTRCLFIFNHPDIRVKDTTTTTTKIHVPGKRGVERSSVPSFHSKQTSNTTNMQGKYLIVYHSSLGFRASPIQMLLLDAGVEFEMREPEWGEDRVVAGNPGLPVFAPPVLRKGDFVLSQTCAIMNYLGSIHGYTPTGRVPLPLDILLYVCYVFVYLNLQARSKKGPRPCSYA